MSWYQKQIDELRNEFLQKIKEFEFYVSTNPPTLERQDPEPKREWEIVRFKSTTSDPNTVGHIELKGNEEYVSSTTGTVYSLRAMLDYVKVGSFIIHSVRRTSDNTLWRIGDKIGKKGYPEMKGQIEKWSFGVHGKGLYATFVEEGDEQNTWAIGNLVSLPKSGYLYTSANEDPIHEGDTVWFNYNWTGDILPYKAVAEQAQFANLYYSSKEAAEKVYMEWIYSRPMLSIQEMVDLACSTPDLIDLVKKKLYK